MEWRPWGSRGSDLERRLIVAGLVVAVLAFLFGEGVIFNGESAGDRPVINNIITIDPDDPGGRESAPPPCPTPGEIAAPTRL